MARVLKEVYRYSVEHYMGWCPDCGRFTRPHTEPDAEDYDCPDCGGENVMGAEQALLMGEFEPE